MKVEPPINPPIKFGDRIIVTKTLKRRVTFQPFEYRDWIEIIIPINEAIFIGWRTLSNGRVTRDEDGPIFKPQSYIRCALVCFNDKTNPVYAPVHSISVVN